MLPMAFRVSFNDCPFLVFNGFAIASLEGIMLHMGHKKARLHHKSRPGFNQPFYVERAD